MLRKHLLVATKLHISIHQHKGQPAERIEPVHHYKQKGQLLDPVVFTFEMDPLVGKNISQCLRIGFGGNIDFRMDQSHHKRRCDAVRLPDPRLKLYRIQQERTQPEDPNQAIGQKRRHAYAPENDSQRWPEVHGAYLRRSSDLRRSGRKRYSTRLQCWCSHHWSIGQQMLHSLGFGRRNRKQAERH